MDAAARRRAEIDALFMELLDLPPAAREGRLARAAGEDRELEAAARSLLAASEEEDPRFEPGAMLAGPLVRHLETELAGGEELVPGTRIGRWGLIEELGRGGMAVVYLAARADGQFQQRAALKLLQPSLASQELNRRFEQERQILASLNHPNIARLLDGGVTEDGRPYLVMEQVQGSTIDHYCDQQRLNVRERLSLCLTAARAVDAAHKSLVVHRDLKPSNVLVADGGEVKLLDFGIATLLDTSGASVEQQGHADLRLLTPQYASPEQLRGDPVTTASDAYQLGVLLYELLIGRRPYELSGKSVTEVERLVCEAPVGKPSAAIAADPAASKVASLRRSRPGRLVRELKGDLDAIVGKALAKRPEERYTSAGELVADLERYLAGQPVAAVPATVLYRLGKFAGRHRLAVTTVGAAVMAVAGLTAVYTARLATERDRARLEAEKATQMADYLAGIFRATDPLAAKGGVKTVRELIERGRADLDTELADQPEVRARLRSLLGEVYYNLGDVAPARALFEQALAERRALFGERHLEVAETEIALGFLFTRTSEYRRAGELFESALATQGALLPPDHPDLARTLSGLGFVARVERRLADAHALFERALVLRERAFGPRDPALAKSLQQLGALYAFENNFAAAVPLLRRAAEIQRSSLGSAHPQYANALRALGESLEESGDPRAARAVLEEALSILERAVGPEHLDVASVLVNLGQACFETGDRAVGIAYLDRGQALYSRLLGPDHPASVTAQNALGGAYLRAGRAAEAVPILRRALTTLEQSAHLEPLHLVPIATSLATALWQAGQKRASGELYAKVERILREKRGTADPEYQRFIAETGARLPAARPP